MTLGPIVQPLFTGVTSGSQVAITAKIFASYAEISEDESGAAAGLKVTYPNGSVKNFTPAMQPVTFGDKNHIGRGPLIGTPANYNGSGPSAPATQYCQVESLGSTTVVTVSEWS